MKTRILILSAAVALMSTAALAQSAEYDDMYFNGKDRQKLREKEASEQAAFNASAASKHKKSNVTEEVYADNGNYSARNQNPEYAARTNAKSASEDADYFSSNYTYNGSTASNIKNFNSSYGNWYNSPWVSNNYFGSGIYGWNSPYYGSYYDTWGNPWMNPYYGSGWSSSFSFYYGNSYNYGWNSGFGMGMGYAYNYANPYYNSWASWGWGPSLGYGGMGGFGYYGGSNYYGGYPGSVVIINNDYRNGYSYGKRGNTNGMVTQRQSAISSRPASTVNPNTTTGGSRPVYGSSTGGRMAATSNVSAPARQTQQQDDYYNRNWRTSRQADNYGGAGSRPSYSQPSRSGNSGGWNNSSNSTQTQWNRSSGFDGGRSSGFSSGGGTGGGSHAGTTGSGGGGRTRGRD